MAACTFEQHQSIFHTHINLVQQRCPLTYATTWLIPSHHEGGQSEAYNIGGTSNKVYTIALTVMWHSLSTQPCEWDWEYLDHLYITLTVEYS